tara:strand:+ start:1400 stop:1609 length:210 start_codon:yes stop_codon:yes gene_type:complete
MEKNKKPIENIKEDLQSVIFKVELLHKDIIDLKKINKEVIEKIEDYQKVSNEIDKELEEKLKKPKGWFY